MMTHRHNHLIALLLLMGGLGSALTSAEPVTLRDPLQVYGSLGGIEEVAYFPGGSEVLVCARENPCYRMEVAGGPLQAITVAGQAHALSPDGQRMLIGFGLGSALSGTTIVADTATGSALFELVQPSTAFIKAVAWSHDGNLAAMTGEFYSETLGEWTGFVSVYDLASAQAALFSVETVDQPTAIAFSPDDSRVAIGGNIFDSEIIDYSGHVELREARTGTHVRTLSGPLESVFDVAFAPDGARIAASGQLITPTNSELSGGVVIWDTNNGGVVSTLEGDFDNALDVAYSVDGARLYVAGDAVVVAVLKNEVVDSGRLTAWDLASESPLWSAQGPGDAYQSLALSSDGQRLLVGTNSGALIERSAANGALLNTRMLDPMYDEVLDTAFMPGETQVLTVANEVRLWDAETGALLEALPDSAMGPFNSVDVSATGRHVAASNWSGDTLVWDLTTNDPPMSLSSDLEVTFFSRFHPDGGSVFAAGSTTRLVNQVVVTDSYVAQYNVSTGDVMMETTGLAGSFATLAVSPDGRFVAAARFLPSDQTKQSNGFSNEVFLFNANTGALERILVETRFSTVFGLAFSPSSTRLAVVGRPVSPLNDPSIMAWNIDDFTVDFELRAPLTTSLLHVAFAPNEQRLAASGTGLTEILPGATPIAGTTLVYDLFDSNIVYQVLTGRNLVHAARFSADGQFLLTANADQTAKLFELVGEGEGEGEGECDEYCTTPIEDQDGDGLDDCEECRDYGTDPLDSDSDGDGIPDGWEVEQGLNPLADYDAFEDFDGDGLNSLEEFLRGSDPDDPASPDNTVFVGPAGSDITGNGTRTAPWATVAFALGQTTGTQVSPARISLLPGIYMENVNLEPFTTLTGPQNDVATLNGWVTGANGSRLTNLDIQSTGLGAPLDPLLLIDEARMIVSNVRFNGGTARSDTGIVIAGSAASGTVIERCRFSGLAVGIDLVGALPFIRRCFFENLADAGIRVRSLPATKNLKAGLGDETSPESGWNTFKTESIDGFAVENQTDTELSMENNDWDTDDEATVAANISGPADFSPFLPKGAGIAAATLFCTVWDDATDARIENASVRLAVSSFAPVTENDNGVYAFPALAPTSYTITVSAPDYADVSVPVVLTEGALKNVTIPLGDGGGNDGGPSCRPTRDAVATRMPEVLLGLTMVVILALAAGARRRKAN